MADNLLLITDDLRRGERLARDLGRPHTCTVHDLYDETLPSQRPDMIVSDVRELTSDNIVRLRRCVDGVGGTEIPHLLLSHGNTARAEMQARLLGAEVLPAAAAARLLAARLKRASTQVDVPILATGHARKADRFLTEVFFSGAPVTNALADQGTELIAEAIREAGIRDWVRVVRRFDDVTHQHILLVAGLSAAFAASLGLNVRDRHQLAKAALLHDVGKTRIPAAILNKPGRLEGDELSIMRSHAAIGHAMLVEGGYDPETLIVARSHHEMLDGSGYPDGLRAEQIPDRVRLVTVCDIYGALLERRPYKAAMSGAEAMAILESMTGRLDGDLVRAFRPVAGAFGAAAGAAA